MENPAEGTPAAAHLREYDRPLFRLGMNLPPPSFTERLERMSPPELHPAYFNVRFRGPWPDLSHPDEFAIITAHATTGENWSEERNRAADLELENELRVTGLWMRRITGYDPATGHAEPGWAVEIAFEAACDLGRRFKQDAIFWVSGNRVWVAKCASDLQSAGVGLFSDRFAMEQTLR